MLRPTSSRHLINAASVLLALTGFATRANAATRAFVVESDFSSGSFSGIDVPTRAPACDVASVSGDPRVRWFGGLVYVINRSGASNIQMHDGTNYAFVRQFSVGAGSNPYDIAFASATKAYVARYDTPDLWVVNPATGAHTGTISLAGFADADGIPEMDHLQRVGPLLFVSLQRLDRNNQYAPTAYSAVAVIDTRTDAIVDCDAVSPGVQPIVLARKNPVTGFVLDVSRSRLYVGCAGNYGVADGGIEGIDAAALVSTGVVASEDSLGGDVLDIAWHDDDRAYAIVSNASFDNSLIRWSPVSGRRTATLFSPGGFTLSDAEVTPDGTEVWVCHSAFLTPGVRVFSTATGASIASPITCTLPPQGMTFDTAEVVAVGLNTPSMGLRMSAPSPNPARGPVQMSLSVPVVSSVVFEVLDVTGRRVRSVVSTAMAAGVSTLAWDLNDDDGRRVRPGLYRVRARAGQESVARAVIVLE